MEKYIDFITNQIYKLTTIPSPTGYTSKATGYIGELLKSLNVPYSITNKGTLIASFEGEDNSSSRIISAHVDTLGAMVKEIKSDGRIAFDKIGGYMLNAIEGENCIIETICGKQYTGTILTIKPSVHIYDDAASIKRSLENMEIVIDEKVNTKEDVEKLGIDVGDFVFLDPRTQITPSGFIKSRHLDDKASAGILLGIIKYIVENNIKPAYRTHFLFSTYEEVGHGASAIPSNVSEFLAVDMGAPGIGQNSSEYAVCICAKDSSGPMDYEMRKKLIAICKGKNIDYKIDLYPHYSSDASAALKSGNDFKFAIIGTGVFASHAYERTHRDGVLNTAKLVAEYVVEK